LVLVLAAGLVVAVVLVTALLASFSFLARLVLVVAAVVVTALLAPFSLSLLSSLLLLSVLLLLLLPLWPFLFLLSFLLLFLLLSLLVLLVLPSSLVLLLLPLLLLPLLLLLSSLIWWDLRSEQWGQMAVSWMGKCEMPAEWWRHTNSTDFQHPFSPKVDELVAGYDWIVGLTG
jgi:hypothetical protein